VLRDNALDGAEPSVGDGEMGMIGPSGLGDPAEI
jgi:hypothetical protein